MRWFSISFIRRRSISVAVAVILLCPYVGSAAVPAIVNYQGFLTDGSGQPVADGTYQMKFKIYGDPVGPDSLWWTGFENVEVLQSSFSYMLGASVAFSENLFDADTRYLGITVGAGSELVPRIRLVSAPYALHSMDADSSGYASTVADSCISTVKLADNAVTTGKVADGSIMDADLSVFAHIDPSKVDGTAMVLYSSSWQTVSGFVEFDGPVYMHDSSFMSSQYGIKIGSRAAHSSDGALLEITRDYSSTGSKYGGRVVLENSSTGSLNGFRSEVEHTTAGSGGTATAVYGHATSDGSIRNGLSGIAETQNAALTTGTSYGVSASAFDGAVAYGIYAYAGSATTNYAGYFSGNVTVTNTLSKGGGSFRIDHPLDPENRYLQHSFVESPDMMNIYNGNVVLDSQGEADVSLPEWFEALNRDFRYQLTAIGAPGPNLHVAEEIIDSHFRIAGGAAGMTVSWQVTGVRKDRWANANRIQVELQKDPSERGKYLHPEVYDLPIERSVDYESLRPVLESRMSRD